MNSQRFTQNRENLSPIIFIFFSFFIHKTGKRLLRSRMLLDSFFIVACNNNTLETKRNDEKCNREKEEKKRKETFFLFISFLDMS